MSIVFLGGLVGSEVVGEGSSCWILKDTCFLNGIDYESATGKDREEGQSRSFF